MRRGTPERYAYAADLWPKNQLWKMQGEPARYAPDAVVQPGTEAEIIAICAAVAERSVPLIPYGAGSGVCGGTVPIRGGVIMDVRRLRNIGPIDPLDMTVTVDAGVIGMHLEETLAERGYTLGHFPSSILCSTVGGWVAARSAGQFSSKYGKIEDMVVGVRVVLPDGRVVETHESQPHDLTALYVGSEGTLGTIVSATLRVHPAPETQVFRGFRFRTLDDAVRGIRLLMQSGKEPCLVRLYDPVDTLLHRSKDPAASFKDSTESPSFLHGLLDSALGRGAKKAGIALALGNPSLLNRLANTVAAECLLIVGFEGATSVVDRDAPAAWRLLEDAGGVDGGEGPGRQWLEKRYAVSFKQSAIYAAGAFVDTLEVGCTWSRLLPVYHAVRAALAPHALIMAHMSHAYREGCSIYFTFAAHRRDPKALERHYDRVIEEALTAVIREGGSIAHHHGVGLAKRDHMAREHGAGLRLLYAAKDALDPFALMNPGKVLPDRAVTQ